MIILGSTGSIGASAFEIALSHGIDIEMLSAGENIALLNEQIKRAKPPIIAIKNPHDTHKIITYPNQQIFAGESGILQALEHTKSKLALNALVGFSGLAPSIKILELHKKLALANKETLVIAGEFIDTSNIIPVDSEHFALKELMDSKNNVKKIILTASGGALRDCPLEKLSSQNAKSALCHPNWAMGKKITIDSATMMNKLFEILEAKWLFGNRTSEFDALIERNSIVHALIEMQDNSFSAHLGVADMRLSISHAITQNAHFKPHIKELDLCKCAITFEPIETSRYPLWNLKDEILKNPRLGIIINAANEILVHRFLRDEITFGDIHKGIYGAIERFEQGARNIRDISDIVALDGEIRASI